MSARWLARFVQAIRFPTELYGLLVLLLFFASLLPEDLFYRATPAAGGDMGSHFWPLKVLTQYGIPHHTLRLWNPGNLCGEPQLLHYFPLPFLIMALLSTFLPLGMAFNWGTLLPAIFFPISAWAALKGLRAKFPIPLLGAAFAAVYLYNESFTMWGGNLASTLAGQFAHLYALNFLLLAVGALAGEIRERAFPFLSSFLLAAVATSHGYVELGVPLVLIALIFFNPHGSARDRVKICGLSGFLSLLLSAWFLVPMLANQPWTTPAPIVWKSETFWKEASPPFVYPLLGLTAASALFFLALPGFRKEAGHVFRRSAIWLLPAGGYLILYFFMTGAGYVSVRAIPQIQLFLCLAAAVWIGELLRRGGAAISWACSILFLLGSVAWASAHVENIPSWMSWNYSGWETKPLYQPLKALNNALRGNFSQPRVIYEHNLRNGNAGSDRVFEMIPYFSGRATLESVYLQATIVAPMVFRLQAEVSKTPSCPFIRYDCPHYNLKKALPRLRLMGVGEMILQTPELLSEARTIPDLRETGRYGFWRLFRFREQPSLVGFFREKPSILNTPQWKGIFYDWFRNYQGKGRMLVVNPPKESNGRWQATRACRGWVEVSFNEIHLFTTCPDVAHYLKFSYHPAWKASTGDPLFLVSPGFLGIIPSQREVRLRFGPTPLWLASDALSWLSVALLSGLWLRKGVGFRPKKMIHNGEGRPT